MKTARLISALNKAQIKIEQEAGSNKYYVQLLCEINYMDLYLIEEALEGADNTLQFLTGINVNKLSEARTIVRAAIEKAWKIRQ